ncbi:hypothetical protein DI392_17480 [Vibrio albus]|uniref:Uncharacterized protein n=1 Tax=Vibrio albus TaxID=2200953 RepID=A0A2U3B5V6_9VIBR|nr:hypothetical protein [Vibrio albus]PWI32152.1 hypothetical protein DI392_17480 [Vibrio albus]
MMDVNENNSKRTVIVVHPAEQPDSTRRPAQAFSNTQDALDYAHEGDDLLAVYEDGTVYSSFRGVDHGASWGESIAESFLYSGLELDKPKILDMCFHEDVEASKAFVGVLVDYVIECHAEREAEL